jgi:hypothetical protein
MEQYDNIQEAMNRSITTKQASSSKVLSRIPDTVIMLMMTKHIPNIFAEVARM